MEAISSLDNNVFWRVLFLVGQGLGLALGLGLVYLLCIAFYNAFFHPLRGFPGPKLWAVTRLPYTHMYLSGDAPRRVLELHKMYGPIVRLAPEILSINHPEAMQQLRGHRKQGMKDHEKDPVQFAASRHNIIGANREDHARYRRTMAHAFSAQAMHDQQPVIKTYVDRLIERLSSESMHGTRPLDMTNWYNYATFDIIGDLAFGESFGCLENATYHPWVSTVFSSLKNIAFMVSMNRYPGITPILKSFIPKGVATKWAEHSQLSLEKVKKRIELGASRPDFIEMMMRGSKGGGMTVDELAANAAVLIIGGSETTATLLSAATYYLGMNPQALATLTEEVRSAFASEDEIELAGVQKLPYMLAVLDETLRLYPPTPNGQPRKIAQGGDTIIGKYIPQDTLVEIWQWALYHNPAYFRQPDAFIPERWLGDARFLDDKQDSVQPFSVGPRNCIGRNLAYAEMRLIMARLIWNFNIELSPDAKDWDTRSKVYILWEKPPLEVYLIPRSDSKRT
ncbi:cytochrome P450 [Thozetella sp. PMI_491]|nr:cytochrome P450 [Thozetella sp. PMI_491]